MPEQTSKADWVWMPHPAHFICAHYCRFHLATWVGNYIVSTVGEHVPPAGTREILAECRGIKLEGRGDAREADWMRKVGFEEIGCGRTYETMVFRAIDRPATEGTCCPYECDVGDGEQDFEGYNDADAATAGHLRLCEKWSKEHA